MSTTSAPLTSAPAIRRLPKTLVWAALIAIAIAFVLKYVLPYFLHFNEAGFGSIGAPNYWSMRGWLMLHIAGGTVALLTGPWQFSTRLRQRSIRLHRALGYAFLTAVALGSIGSFRMAIGTTAGWAFGFGLFVLGLAWSTTAAMAFYAVKQRHIQLHKEWMVRAYIVTFGFVTFRLFEHYGPVSHLRPAHDRAVTLIWASWAIPLLVAEVVMQLQRMRRPAGSRA